MALVETMKKIARQTNEAGAPAAVMFGMVTRTSPLTVRVDNRFDITEDALIVMKDFKAGFNPTHYHTSSAGNTDTGAKSEYYYGLKTGEKVVLLRNQGGQQFLVLGRV